MKKICWAVFAFETKKKKKIKKYVNDELNDLL